MSRILLQRLQMAKRRVKGNALPAVGRKSALNAIKGGSHLRRSQVSGLEAARIGVGGSSKGDLLGEQNETGLKREFSQDVGPAILWGFGWLGDDPELAMGMVDESHGMARGGTDRPTTTEEINLVVGVDASAEVQGQMEVQQAGVRTRAQYDALFFLSLGTGVVRGEAGGAADGAILAGQFVGQQLLCGSVSGNFLIGQKRDEALLKRIKANLSQPEVALNAGVSERMVRAWEHDQLLPTEAEWKVLEAILGLDSTFPKS